MGSQPIELIIIFVVVVANDINEKIQSIFTFNSILDDDDDDDDGAHHTRFIHSTNFRQTALKCHFWGEEETKNQLLTSHTRGCLHIVEMCLHNRQTALAEITQRHFLLSIYPQLD
jgi:hypothetical protein